MRLKWSIAIAGTHGKTTTTSMIGALLETAAARPDRDQRRHHQRLRHQHAARRRRLDGGRGRRERRHLHPAAGDGRDRHQHRPRASRFLRQLRRAAAGVRDLCRQHPVLRLRRAVHRPSGRAGHDPAAVGPPHRDLRASARRPISAPSTSGSAATAARFDVVVADAPAEQRADDLRSVSADVRPSTMCRTRWPRSRSPKSWGSATTRCAQALRNFKGVQAALHQDRRVERRRRSSTITATTRSRSPRC